MFQDDNISRQYPELEERIRLHFEEPRVFLRPKLKLGDMASQIGTNRTYLSKYLNETRRMTFYEYINALRLEYATQLLNSGNDDLNVVATHAGFNSYSTFRRVFTAKYGYPPSEYKKRIEL